jgi:hypothetical protein
VAHGVRGLSELLSWRQFGLLVLDRLAGSFASAIGVGFQLALNLIVSGVCDTPHTAWACIVAFEASDEGFHRGESFQELVMSAIRGVPNTPPPAAL